MISCGIIAQYPDAAAVDCPPPSTARISSRRLDAPKRKVEGIGPVRRHDGFGETEIEGRIANGADAARRLEARPCGHSRGSHVSMISAASSVALTATLPVEVLMKSAPASIASSRGALDERRVLEFAGFEDGLQQHRRRAFGLRRPVTISVTACSSPASSAR